MQSYIYLDYDTIKLLLERVEKDEKSLSTEIGVEGARIANSIVVFLTPPSSSLSSSTSLVIENVL
jgi:hypothetical protein